VRQSQNIRRYSCAFLLISSLSLSASLSEAQSDNGTQAKSTDSELEKRVNDLTRKVEDLTRLVEQLQSQLAKTPGSTSAGSTSANAPTTPAVSAPATNTVPTPPAAPGSAVANMLTGMTFNALVDGYYEYNFNSPVGRVNTLRAYDVSSNSFSLNQADVVIEKLPDIAANHRLGLRLDLQFGQATSTLQGNPANELRPEVYRNVFQAYGTYVVPLAQGLTIDFGKWASSLGIEGNYTKDQLNYSRSLWFDYLPFYHMGIRSKLAINDQLAVNLWITNGTDQTEAFNNYKDQMLGFVLTPIPAVAWTFNYYRGQEHPDVTYLQNLPLQEQGLPNQQGTYILPIANAPNGKLEIADTYVTWQAFKALTLAAEADYVQQRLYSYSSPQRVKGGALYAGYSLTSKLAIAARAEYLADMGGLFSGATQYLKEGTFTFDYRPEDGFLLRGEYRRDHRTCITFTGINLDCSNSLSRLSGWCCLVVRREAGGVVRE
jgi:hypothetical protein